MSKEESSISVLTSTKCRKRSNISKMECAGISVSLSDIEDLFRLKRRKIKVAGAPKMPLNGYVRYMNDRRENLRRERPEKTAIEHTRMIGEEWHQLQIIQKTPYLEAAEKDRQRYYAELQEFLKTHPEILASELARSKVNKNTKTDAVAEKNSNLKQKPTTSNNKQKYSKEDDNRVRDEIQRYDKNYKISNANSNPLLNSRNAGCDNHLNSSCAIMTMQGEIPIFTNEFLEHNKVFDMELRNLRKTKTDLDQQNAVLEKHVDNMKSGVKKLVTENNDLEDKNYLLEIHLKKVKYNLAKALSGLAIPTEPNGASYENIDKYMADLGALVCSSTHGLASVNKAREVIRKLELHD